MAPGEYTAGRVQVKEKASFGLDEFYFLFCVNGGGTVNGQRFQMGDVLFVPQKFGRSTWPEIWTSCTAPIKTNRSTSGDTVAAWLGIPTISKQTSRLFSFLIDFV